MKKLLQMVALAGLVAVGFGCASAKVSVSERNPGNLIVEPDFILVHEFAFAPEKVKLDRGVVTQAVKDMGDKSKAELERELGQSASKALADGLVADLQKAGIQAYKAGSGKKATDKTLVIKGKFIRIDQGNRTARVVVGFGFGNGDIKALVEATQGGRKIARAVVTTSGSFKPGVAVPVAGTAASGASAVSIASLAVNSASTGRNELFTGTIQADCERAANKIAQRVVQGYINHNWADKEDLEKIKGLF